MKTKYLSILLLFASIGLSAQTLTYDVARRRNLWNQSSNIAGLRKDSLSIASAEAKVLYGQGDYKSPDDGSSNFSAGASASALQHLPGLSLTGTFGFTNTEIEGACGSMSARPGRFPVQIYEFTPGHKTRQTYSISGGLATDLGNFTLGLHINYLSENYTKRKDLRHTNYLLDMSIIPAIVWHAPALDLGLSLIFGKTAETISAEELGISSGAYYAFLDKGLHYGVHNVWDNSLVHLSEAGVSGFPVSEYSTGVGLQLEAGSFFMEYKTLMDFGHIGEKPKIWYNYRSLKPVNLRLAYVLKGESADHYFYVDESLEMLENRENILEDSSNNGVTTTINQGYRTIYNKLSNKLEMKWERLSHNGSFVNVSLAYTCENALARPAFPYFAEQKIDILALSSSAMFPLGKGFELRYDLLLSKGFLKENLDKVQSGLVPDFEPEHWSEHADWFNAFRIAPKADINIALRYNLSNGLYFELAGGALSGAANTYFDNCRWNTALKIGYNF